MAEQKNGKPERVFVATLNGREVARDVFDPNKARGRIAFSHSVLERLGKHTGSLANLSADLVKVAVETDREQKLTELERFTTRDLLNNSPQPTWLIERFR